MRYKIDPAGALGVRTRTHGALNDLENTGSFIEDALTTTAEASSSAPVGGALTGFITLRHTPGLAFTLARGEACRQALRTAVNEYLRADKQMVLNAQSHEIVLNAQRSAAGAPDPTATMPARRPG